MKIVYSSPELVSSTRTGNQKFWQGHVVQDGKQWFTQTSYWQINKAGKKSKVQTSAPYEATPKNVGKANEMSAEAQARFEFDSMVTKQRDKGYTEPGTKSNILPLPMLAHKFEDRSHDIRWPAYVQPKFNGQRMLFDGQFGWSRGGKKIIPECIAHLKFKPLPGVILDGELILPGNKLLQETMKATKKYRPGVSEQLLYIVYDIMDSTMTFSERYAELTRILKKHKPENVVLAATYPVDTIDDVKRYHKLFTKDGYEGTMIRSDHLTYESDHRSVQLQKFKDFQDAEFEIVDVIEGAGKFKGCAIFICKTEDGHEFSCTPEGTIAHKKELFKNRKKHIGKFLTIRYQDLSKDKVPLFLVGVDVRDRNDF